MDKQKSTGVVEMYLDEFKCWLKGYLEGVGVEEKEDLEKEDLLVILSKFEEVQPGIKSGYYTWPGSFPTIYGTKNLTTKKVSSMLDELLGK